MKGNRILQVRVNNRGETRLVEKTAFDLSEAVIKRGRPVTIIGPDDARYLVLYCSLALRASNLDKEYKIVKSRHSDGCSTVQMTAQRKKNGGFKK